MKDTSNNSCGDANFPGFCGNGAVDCKDQILKYTDGKLTVVQDGKTLFCQQFFLNEVITEYATKQVVIEPGEEKRLFTGEDAEFVFVWVTWLSESIEFPLLAKYSGFDEDGHSTDFLSANWNPIYNQLALTSIPGYGINDMIIKNLHDAPTSQTEQAKSAKVLVFTAKTV